MKSARILSLSAEHFLTSVQLEVAAYTVPALQGQATESPLAL